VSVLHTLHMHIISFSMIYSFRGKSRDIEATINLFFLLCGKFGQVCSIWLDSKEHWLLAVGIR